jgi:hypothetical protein
MSKRRPVATSVVTAPELHSLATSVGELWAEEVASSLRAADRAVTGAWPGTLGEARMRIRLAIRIALERPLVDELGRIATNAARGAWKAVAETEREPDVGD